MDGEADEDNGDAVDAAFWRANEHQDDFIGLTEEDAITLAARLELTLEVRPAGGWRADVNISGRVIAFVQNGLIVGTTS